MHRGILFFTLICVAFTQSNYAVGAENDKEKMNINNNEVLTALYDEMFKCMISKDTVKLSEMFADEFVLQHMSGYRSPKSEYLQQIKDGDLNYFDCSDTRLTVTVNGDTARVIGKSKVLAAVYGGGKHTWNLMHDIKLRQRNGKWLMLEAITHPW